MRNTVRPQGAQLRLSNLMVDGQIALVFFLANRHGGQGTAEVSGTRRLANRL